MSAKAILRTQQLKTLQSIGGSSTHVARTRPTPNADPQRSNVVMVGSGNPLDDVQSLLPEKRRKNAVLAVEHVLTASPEFFRNKTPEQVREWAEASVASMAKFWGKDNIASAILHLDESTPHIHLYVVPLKNGKLNARHYIGGSRHALSKLQDHYASDMRRFGLERGVKGSKAKHTTVKSFYEALQNGAKLRAVKAEVVVDRNMLGLPKTEVRKFPNTEDALALKAAAGGAKELKRKVEQYQNTAKALEREKARLERERLREIPLADLAQELGLVRDKHDRHKWRTPDGRHINITDQKFYDLDEEKGGGGAIDFAMHVLGTDFKDAIAWLKSRYGADDIADEIATAARERAKRQVEQVEKKEFIPPQRDDSRWPQARAYLQGRGIDMPHPTPSVYADKRGNVVFLGKGRAELVGTGSNKFKGLAAGSSKDSSGFIAGEWRNATHIALVESAIDALSYVELFKDSAAVSTAGAPSEGFLARFFEWVKGLGKVPVLAFDNDQAGRNFRRKALEIAERWFKRDEVVIDVPKHGKDWNDDLMVELSGSDDDGHGAEVEKGADFSFPSRNMM